MQLAHLQYLQAIAKHGSLSAAARALSLSQPALTTAVQALEREMGTVLLYRGRNGATLTDAGAVVLRHAADLFAEVERMHEAVRGLEGSEAGAFTLGCHESLGAYFLPGFLGPFLSECPGIDITLMNTTSAKVRQAVIDREIHFGLVVNPRPHPDIVMVDLFPDAVALFAATDRLAQAPGADDAERADHLLKAGPLVYAGRVMQCQQIIDELAEVGLLPQRMLNCGDLELVKSLTAGGTGVGVLPRRVAAYGQRGRLTPLPDHLPSIPDRIFLLFRGDLHRTRASRRLKDAIIAFGQALPTPTF